MSFVVLYRDSGSVLGTYTDREHAVSAAIKVAMERPDLSLVVGLTEVGDDGLRVASFESASDLLASGDQLATTIVDSLATQSQVAIEPAMTEQSLEEDALASGEEVSPPRMAPTLLVGESLVGEGDEVAHVDVLIGSKSGPVGKAFAHALVNQRRGHTNLLAIVAPNLPAKPDTIMSNKVTIEGAAQAVQMFGPAQAAVARGVVDSVRDGVISEGDVDDLCIICGVFIHWDAKDDKKVFDYNYQATKEAIARALNNEPSVRTVMEAEATFAAPFA